MTTPPETGHDAAACDRRVPFMAKSTVGAEMSDEDVALARSFFEATTPAQRLKILDDLYKENAGRISMREAINYPLNYKSAVRWANSHCDAQSIKFANEIIANTIYVPFCRFMDELRAVCASFIKTYAPRRGSAQFVLILPFGMQKSNVWVSLLAYPHIRDILTDIDFTITGAYNRLAGHTKAGGVVCVVCDDCMYTGNQIMSFCALDPRALEYEGKKAEPAPTAREWIDWHATAGAKAKEEEARIDKARFAVALVVPYMSTDAQQRLVGNPMVVVPRNINVFKVFRERVAMHEYGPGVIREFESTFQYHSTISAIYFDHKIADAVSTFNKIYLLAPVFHCGNLRKSMCFIDNCCSELRDAAAAINPYEVHTNLEDLLKSKACPRSFHKTIKYTFRGHPIREASLVSVFAGPPHTRSKQHARGQRRVLK